MVYEIVYFLAWHEGCGRERSSCIRAGTGELGAQKMVASDPWRRCPWASFDYKLSLSWSFCLMSRNSKGKTFALPAEDRQGEGCCHGVLTLGSAFLLKWVIALSQRILLGKHDQKWHSFSHLNLRALCPLVYLLPVEVSSSLLCGPPLKIRRASEVFLFLFLFLMLFTATRAGLAWHKINVLGSIKSCRQRIRLGWRDRPVAEYKEALNSVPNSA